MADNADTSTRNGDSRQGRGRALDSVTAYRLARSLADEAWDDATLLSDHPMLADVARQLLRAIGSIAANIAEGYSRRSPRDRIRYYEYALGSLEETGSWYHIAKRVIPAEHRTKRENRLTSIRRLLVTMINNERKGDSWNSPRR